ncbi:hypothetical protein OXIME_001023 [Oxyplasma meridianum]|uniref:Uncharacterized protein n=1 Tax=Oxyplasma meridianum TaxID=3073602 RepID=A0AAX4NH05_9ARCH
MKSAALHDVDLLYFRILEILHHVASVYFTTVMRSSIVSLGTYAQKRIIRLSTKS